MTKTGLIVKATGGFYYVAAGAVTYECRARGIFRTEKISPLVGDTVAFEPLGEATGSVTEILPHKNQLVRPPLANLDTFVLVTSVADPAPNPLVLDKLIAIACHKAIRPMLVITKSDLGAPDRLLEIYQTTNIQTFVVSPQSGEGIEALRQALSKGISASHRPDQPKAGAWTPHHPPCGAVPAGRRLYCGYTRLFGGRAGTVRANPQGRAGRLLLGVRALS